MLINTLESTWYGRFHMSQKHCWRQTSSQWRIRIRVIWWIACCVSKSGIHPVSNGEAFVILFTGNCVFDETSCIRWTHSLVALQNQFVKYGLFLGFLYDDAFHSKQNQHRHEYAGFPGFHDLRLGRGGATENKRKRDDYPDSKVHVANVGPAWDQ